MDSKDWEEEESSSEDEEEKMEVNRGQYLPDVAGALAIGGNRDFYNSEDDCKQGERDRDYNHAGGDSEDEQGASDSDDNAA